MKYRNFCGNNISLLGFGCMRVPMINDKVDLEKSMELIDYAIEQGINYYDTAYVYSNGSNESFVGEIVKKYGREKLYLATKLPLFSYTKQQEFYTLLDEQLSNMNTEFIDYYLFHALNKDKFENMQKENYKEFIKDIKDNKVKHIGFSFHDDYETFVKIVDDYDWEFCQLQFNYIDAYDQDALKMYEYAKSKNIEVVIMEPLRGGRLTHVPKDVRTILDEKFKELTDADISFKYISDFSNNKVILSGMRTIEDIKKNCEIFSTFEANSLTNDELECYKKAEELFRSYSIINCTKCDYCKEGCPVNIPISSVFEKYNHQLENPYLNEDVVKTWYKNLDSNGSNCIKCKKCERVCPQHLEIVNLLDKCDEYFK